MATNLAESGLSSGNKTKRLHVLLWGPPGSWKTVMAHGMPNTRTIDFDDGLQSVEWAILAGKIKKELSDIIYKTILPDGRDKQSILVAG
jgi:replication-associated recombination protein RarA